MVGRWINSDSVIFVSYTHLDVYKRQALCILERMNTYSDNPSFGFAFHECMKIAKATDDEVWLNNLLQIDRKIV